jgi:hypothetical protein
MTKESLEALKVDLSKYENPKFETSFEKGWNGAIDKVIELLEQQ